VLTPDEIRLVERSRAAQGLPPKVDDPGVLTKVVTLLRASRRDGDDAHDAHDADDALDRSQSGAPEGIEIVPDTDQGSTVRVGDPASCLPTGGGS
jgi:hypothetical protein